LLADLRSAAFGPKAARTFVSQLSAFDSHVAQSPAQTPAF